MKLTLDSIKYVGVGNELRNVNHTPEAHYNSIYGWRVTAYEAPLSSVFETFYQLQKEYDEVLLDAIEMFDFPEEDYTHRPCLFDSLMYKENAEDYSWKWLPDYMIEQFKAMAKERDEALTKQQQGELL